MQLDLAPRDAPGAARRVVALCFPDLPLQRALRAREAASAAQGGRAAPLAVERDGRVVACDPEARAYGVRAGDALAEARAACGELEVAPIDDAADLAELEALAEAMLALAPAVEVAPPDALLLDASGAHLLAPEAAGERLLAQRALAAAAALGLRGRAAAAVGRGPARALARHGLGGDPIAPGAAAAALAPLPLSALALEARLAERLASVGLRTVGDLAQLPGEAFAHRFGPGGVAAWRLARGEDPSPLTPFAPRSLPREAIDLEAPIEAAEPLLFASKRLCDRAAARLAGRGLGATRLALALRLHPRGAERIAIPLARPSTDPARWMLVLRERLGELALPAPVAGMALEVEEASAAPREQLSLEDRPQQMVALETVLARLAARLGDGALFAAAPVERHRPEGAFRARAFTGKKEPMKEETPRPAQPKRRATRPRGARGPGASASTSTSPATSAATSSSTSTSTRNGAAVDVRDDASPPSSDLARPTRLLARPEQLVALGEGGRLSAVRFGGRALRVLALSPVERLAGDWWSEPFERDYHRARIEGLGDCWIYRDASGRLWLHGFFD
jgi:protein ImuB